jgi:hypothetical protein
LDKKLPSLVSGMKGIELVLQPAPLAASPAAHKTSAILEMARQRKTISPGGLSACPLKGILRHHDGGHKPRPAKGLTEPLADRALADGPLA